jgi:Ca2+-binding RTX toxin-like protein
MVNIVKHDLQFILKQIKIAERHAAGEDLQTLVAEAGGVDPNSPASAQIHLLPYGLRTVDGSYNNLVPGREEWGAADQEFLNLTEPQFTQGTGTFPYAANNDYGQAGGVTDAQPRLISNLVVDQTLDNPAAIVAALEHAGVVGAAQAEALQAIRDAHVIVKALPTNSPAYAPAKAHLDALLEDNGIVMDGPTVFLPNVSPDIGDSAPYSALFTLFGQFFDHGLDLVAKGGNDNVYIPLSPDDPLYNPASPHTNFMVLTRVTTGEGARNSTTPWVDQNQTYGSNASKQVFMREYAAGPDGKPMATGLLLEGKGHGLATWADVKAQAAEKLGIKLTDMDIGNIPLIVTDEYGNFIPGANGYAQLVVGVGVDGVFGTADDELVEGNPLAPVDPTAVGAARTGHAFLDDIAHNAAPGTMFDHDGLPGTPMIMVAPDADEATATNSAAGNHIAVDGRGNKTAYDNELLDAHFITGDGRGNENIGLTTIHHIFHGEHNRMVEETKAVALEAAAAGDLAFLNEWLLVDVDVMPANPATLVWDGERLFQAARFVTEMEYQHLVFEEFARKMQPDVDAFLFEPDPTINPAIFSEFANVVYRFGHSMLNENVDRIGADGTSDHMSLFDAFLNPVAYDEGGTLTHAQAAGAIIRGMSAQVGNEIDEFVTNTLRNQLLGIPLDLATINIARGRDTGMPTLNEARAQFQAMAHGDSQLAPYASWTDFALNLKNPASIVNFIAAYGTHGLITGETTIEGKRAAAMAIVFGTSETFWDPVAGGFRTIAAPDADDRTAFLNATGDYATPRLGGLMDVDLWVGGLAEKKMDFGGMLGSTFSFIFELQMENLQDGDRFYYLSRTQGLNLLSELEGNSLSKMALRTTDLGETGSAIPGDFFSRPDRVLYVDAAKQAAMTGLPDPVQDNAYLQALSPLVERLDKNGDGHIDYLRYNGGEHVVVQGTDRDDHIITGEGDDTIWGGAGNDRLEGGYGVDHIHGGTGDDIITNAGTDIGAMDFLHGEEGNDVIHGGSGLSLIFGNEGSDFLIAGPDGKTVMGGIGNDFILGGDGMDFLLGEAGDDWMEGGGRFDTLAGENSELMFNSTIIGNDVLNGQGGDTDYDAEAGDDIMFQGVGIQRSNGMAGFDWAIHKDDAVAANSDLGIPIFANQEAFILRDRFDLVEGLSGWKFSDTLTGRVVPVNTRVEATGTAAIPGPDSPLYSYSNALLERNVALIDGLNTLVAHRQRYVEVGNDGVAETVVMDTADASDILLGGGGSDRIKGLAGSDIIDGDKWLNVRIRITVGSDVYTADGMTKKVYLEADMERGALRPGAVAQFGGRALDALMLAGVLNPGQLSIVREIVDGNVAGDIDTAVYTGIREHYGFGVNTDGSLYVDHAPPATDETDPLAENVEGVTERPVLDGRDTVRNIERLEFTDLTMNVISGTAGNETLNGDAVGTGLIHDVLMGFAGNDTLNGLTGNDVLIGGAGNDTLRGGAGDDIYVFGLADGVDRIEETGGNDRISIATNGAALTDLNFSRAANGDLLITLNGQTIRVAGQFNGAGSAVETITFDGGSYNGYQLYLADDEGDEVMRGAYTLHTGTGTTLSAAADVDTVLVDLAGNQATTLLGNTGDDMLFGNNGADILNGGAGVDLLVGGAGSDTYIVDDLGDTVVELANGGTDTVQTTLASYLLDANVENLAYTGTGSFTGAGNGLDNTLTGGVGNDSLYGGAGNDRLFGEDGNDFLDGGDGDDTINAGAGNDAVRGGAGNDTINVGDGFSTIVYDTADFGNDTVASFDANPNGGGQDRIDLSGLGITSADFASRVTITANGTSTRVDVAGGGSITLNGVTGAGNNAISIADFILSGGNTIIGTAAGETLAGTAGADIILGGGGADTINGLSGNDTIDGGAGDDDLFGDSGDDIFHWQAPSGGWDVVDGGSEGIAGDTFVITGDDSYEIFRFYPAEDAEAVIPGLVLRGSATEIVVTRTVVVNGVEGTPEVIAELAEIEEIVINGSPANGVGTAGGDRFELIGDFAEQGEETSLRLNTITILGSEGDDTVDISRLASAHRVVFKSKGGNDTIIGTLRPQDVIQLPDNTTIDDFDVVQNANGSTTLVGEDHSVTFFSNGVLPQFSADDGHGGFTPPEAGNGDEGSQGPVDNDGDDDTGGIDDDDNETPDQDDDDGDIDDDDDDDDNDGDDDGVVPGGVGNVDGGSPQVLIGTSNGETLAGGNGRDMIFAGDGADNVLGGGGSDMIYGDAGNDRLFGDAGDDLIDGGTGNDTVFGGDGNDIFVASVGDGDDVYYGDNMNGGTGNDTLDMSAIGANITADLGTGFNGRGSVTSAQSGSDTIWGVENIVTGSGNDTITASAAVNVMDGGTGNDTFRFLSAADADGDTIMGFQPGDRLDLSGMDANWSASGNQAFTLVSGAFAGASGELLVTHENRDGTDYTVVEGNTSGGGTADFKISIKGSHNLTSSDFDL